MKKSKLDEIKNFEQDLKFGNSPASIRRIKKFVLNFLKNNNYGRKNNNNLARKSNII